MTDINAPSDESAGDIPSAEARILFQHWQAGIGQPLPPGSAAIDPTEFAAWLQDNTDETASAAIDAALTRDAEMVETLLALRAGVTLESPSAAFLARAQSLVPATASATPIPFRRVATAPVIRQRGRIPFWLGAGAIAASLVLVSVGGFNAGISLGNNVAPALQGHAASPVPSESDPASSAIDDVIG